MKPAYLKERELIVKLHFEGKSTYRIADILGMSQTKASFWVRRFKKTTSLENKPRSGRPTKLTAQKLGKVAAQLRAKLMDNGRKAGLSSKKVMDVLQKETGKKYSMRHVQRSLHKMGFSLVTPRVSHIKKDKQKQAQFREEFKKNSRRNMWVTAS